MFFTDVDITQINNRFHIAGQCWKNRTEVHSERNNSIDLKTHITNNFGKNVLVVRFGTFDPIFDNEVIFDLPEYDIPYTYSVAKAARGWLKLDLNNVIIFEIRGNIQKLMFVASCCLKFNNFFLSSNDACDYIIKTRYKNMKTKSNTLLRYLDYFENLDLLKTKSLMESLKLKQIIVMNYPKFDDNIVKPFFEIGFDNEKNQYKEIKMLVDENYIIGEFGDIYPKADCSFGLYYVVNKKTYQVFEICLNTVFMQESLYRFKKSDVLFHLSEFVVKTKVKNDFMVDIVFLCGKTENKPLYNIETTYLSCLNTLSQHLKNEANHFELKKLVKEGYNRLYAKLYLQLKYTYEEAVDKLRAMDEKKNMYINSCHKLSHDAKALFNNNETKSANDTSSIINEEMTKGNGLFTKRPYLEEYTLSETDITHLDLIPDKVIPIKSEQKAKGKKNSPFSRRSAVPKSPPEPDDIEGKGPKMVVRKPLHWNEIQNTDLTFFEKIEMINVPLDIEKFEEWFCEPIAKQATKKLVTKKTVIKDDQRLFLVSISLKTLEKKHIDIYDLDEIIYSKAFELSYEDLQNILRVLPTEAEMKILQEYQQSNKGKNALRDLNQIEQMLMINMDSYELRNVINILMFERKFNDEYKNIEKCLLRLKSCFYSIIENNNLRVILKVLLDIGNLVNYKYSRSKTRRKAKGFKVLSLQAMSRYTGIRADNKLTTFLLLTLLGEKSDVFLIFDELRSIKEVKLDSLGPIKENINVFVQEYNEASKRLALIDKSQQNSHIIKLFLGFAHEKLKYFTDIYKEILLVASLIKRKFGEDEEVSINEILSVLHEFLQKIEEEYRIQSLEKCV